MVVVSVKVDHDARNSPRLWLRELVRRAERANVVIEAVRERRSASGEGWHRIIYTRTRGPVSASQIVALQLLFGSDPLREAYNFNRARVVDAGLNDSYWRSQEAWDILYKSPYKWRLLRSKLLAAHRERNGDARTVNARDRKKG